MKPRLRRWLDNLSLARKLSAIAAITTGGVAGAGLHHPAHPSGLDGVRRAQLRELVTITDIVSMNSTASVSFGDPRSGR